MEVKQIPWWKIDYGMGGSFIWKRGTPFRMDKWIGLNFGCREIWGYFVKIFDWFSIF